MRPSGFRRLLEWWCHRIAAGPERQNELTRCIQQKLAKAAKKTFVDLINRDYLCLRRAELGHTAPQLKRIPLPLQSGRGHESVLPHHVVQIENPDLLEKE